MGPVSRPIRILMADDDADDCALARDALELGGGTSDLRFVHDGEELLDYLYHRGDYADSPAHVPELILLDLNMPRMDGREALATIKQDSKLRRIPVVVLTTSDAEEDVARSYDLGASSFIVKSTTFEGLVQSMEVVSAYWSKIVKLPKYARAS